MTIEMNLGTLHDFYAGEREPASAGAPEDVSLSDLADDIAFERDWDDLIARLKQEAVSEVRCAYACITDLDGLVRDSIALTFLNSNKEEVWFPFVVHALCSRTVKSALVAQFPDWTARLGSYGAVSLHVEKQTLSFDHREFVATPRACEASINVHALLERGAKRSDQG